MTHVSTSTGTSPERARQHVDRAALGELLDSLGGDARVFARFTRDFVSLWESRLERLATALAQVDANEAHVVLLSIRSTSVMVGAVRLETVAARVHEALRCGDFDGCRQQLTELADVGAGTCSELVELVPGLQAPA